MFKLKKTIAIATLFSLLPATTLFAATELTKQQADTLQPYKEISIRGTYPSIKDAVKAVAKNADKEGAASFYIKSMNFHSRNESLRIIYADLYKADAPNQEHHLNEHYRIFHGVYEYPKQIAIGFEPYDIIKLRAYYPNQHDINNAVGKAAADKGAYAFFIDRQVEVNGRNTAVTAYLFKKDAPIRQVQPDDAIPYDSEAGQLALAQGGDAALQVEKPGYYSSTAFNEQYYAEKFKSHNKQNIKANNEIQLTTKSNKINTTEDSTTIAVVTTEEKQATIGNQKSKVIIPKQRYTIKLKDGTTIQELNDATAAKMVPFDSLKFRGYFVSDNQISTQAARKAAAAGAKYYHISRIAQEPKGPNRVVYVDLFK